MAEEYLAERQELALCVQLIDSRHKPTELDMQLNEWLVHHRKPHIIAATKTDKLSNNELRKTLSLTQKMLGDVTIVPYSATTARGRDELWGEINTVVEKY